MAWVCLGLLASMGLTYTMPPQLAEGAILITTLQMLVVIVISAVYFVGFVVRERKVIREIIRETFGGN